jgi:amino acid adenylation domain-containing protein
MAADRVRLVQEILERSAEHWPAKIALVSDGRRWTYSHIDRQVNQLAHALRGRGVARGDRVLLLLPNGPELVVGIFAVLKAGGVFVVVNPTTKPDKLVYLAADSGARALLARVDRREAAHRLLEESPDLKTVALSAEAEPADLPEGMWWWEQAYTEFPDHRPPLHAVDLDLACLIYTSGSTGEPKGVMSDHSNMLFVMESILEYIGNTPDDIVIGVLPLSFSYGLYQLLMTFRFGGRLILEKGFAYPAEILRQVEAERVTGFPGVPTQFSLLLSMDLAQFDLSSVRYLTNAAAALPPAHIRRLREAFPHARLFSMYGLTETKRTLYLPPEELDHRPDSVGKAIPGTEVWLEDEAGRRLGPGEVGELVVRGRHVMRGYWGDPQASAERFRPGPLAGERLCYTGDLFRMDAEGFFYFVGRKDDIIKTRGEKVSPKEVENVLYRLPGIQEAAVIGVPDPVLGQAIKAYVVLNGAILTEADILRHCREYLEELMVPRFVEFRPELPKTGSGKIRRAELA